MSDTDDAMAWTDPFSLQRFVAVPVDLAACLDQLIADDQAAPRRVHEQILALMNLHARQLTISKARERAVARRGSPDALRKAQLLREQDVADAVHELACDLAHVALAAGLSVRDVCTIIAARR